MAAGKSAGKKNEEDKKRDFYMKYYYDTETGEKRILAEETLRTGNMTILSSESIAPLSVPVPLFNTTRS